MKTRRTVRRKQKGGFDEGLAKIWRQRLRFADSFHDFHKVNNRVQEELRDFVNDILLKSISVEQLQSVFPIVTPTLANYENGIHEYLLGAWESQFTFATSTEHGVLVDNFKEMYSSLFGIPYVKTIDLYIICDAGLVTFGNFLSEVKLNPEIGEIIYIINPATIADSASSIGPCAGIPFILSDAGFEELPDEAVNVFGEYPIIFQNIKISSQSGGEKRKRETPEFKEEKRKRKETSIIGKINITFSHCVEESCCEYSYPISMPNTSQSGPSIHELSKSIVITSGMHSNDKVDNRYRSFLGNIDIPGPFFDIKRAGDYQQVLSALRLHKRGYKIIFTTVDILCATYAILHGIPTIFQYKGKFRWHSKRSLDTLMLPRI